LVDVRGCLAGPRCKSVGLRLIAYPVSSPFSYWVQDEREQDDERVEDYYSGV
jgi:hypothetical protein